MKLPRSLLFPAFLSACGASTPVTTASAPASPVAPAPVPVTEGNSSAECEGERLFLGTGPSTPLAIADSRGLRSAGQGCCEAFANQDATWIALDAYGRSRGTAQVFRATMYDVTRCLELDLQGPAGTFEDNRIDRFTTDTIFGFASSEPTPGTPWEPTPAEIAALESFLAQMRPILGIGENPVPLAERTLFFEDRDPYLGDHGEGETLRYAVVGGRALIIARKHGDGFVLSHVENDITHNAIAHDRMYLPAAALDFGGDEGETEVVFRWNEAPVWNLKVLSRRYILRDGWRLRAEDIGGATI